MNQVSIEAIKEQARMSWRPNGKTRVDWYAKEEQIKVWLAKGYGVARVADELGVSCPTVRKWLRKFGLKTIWQD